ncbi:HET-domain-containing protein, partial [Stipitochalara longipes BDJ]
MPAPSELLPRDPVSQGPFAYKPLSRDVDSIRLLTLQPSDQEPAKGKTNPEVRCKLSHVTFAEKPQYQALSYTWGDPHHLKEIILDGVRVKVRENLFWALFHLRSSTPIFLWADAICIDQSNPEERSYQVRLMDYIYSRASCVLVWLGKTSAVTRVRNREFFQELISHPYWSRLWVIQEIALSMKLQVRVESYSFTWTEFLLEIKRSIPEGRRMPITRLDDLRRDRNGPNNRLEVLMEAFQDAQCADPRDKIFGFLGLAHDCQDGTIEADYTKPLFHLYADVIAFFSRS